MELPSHVKVGPYEYTVKRIPFYETDGLQGHLDQHSLEIMVCSDGPPQHRIATFIHEVLHAVAEVYRVALDEPDVECMANGLVDALQSIGWLPTETAETYGLGTIGGIPVIEEGADSPIPPPGVYRYQNGTPTFSNYGDFPHGESIR